ncbi:MAG: hypothetical protein O210_OD1C00001G0375 [Parcubacteria bacterium RAAC4_OD1_1]|nr:MAG: hypothetical protein O210_OD1C00001G0375 [Parcubacteria bacterium RAAC4_OD1_1]
MKFKILNISINQLSSRQIAMKKFIENWDKGQNECVCPFSFYLIFKII